MPVFDFIVKKSLAFLQDSFLPLRFFCCVISLFAVVLDVSVYIAVGLQLKIANLVK